MPAWTPGCAGNPVPATTRRPGCVCKARFSSPLEAGEFTIFLSHLNHARNVLLLLRFTAKIVVGKVNLEITLVLISTKANTMETMTKGTPLGNTRAASDLMPPHFDTVDEERKHRKQRLAAAFRLFAHFGYDEGLAGHITARDPEHTDRFWVNPLGVHFAHITSADLVLVSHEGKVIEGGRPVNAAAFAIHSAIHK